MKFRESTIQGAYCIEIDKKVDDRGFFARTWDASEFKEKGLESSFVQTSIAYTKRKGTLRGMHFQKSPHEENKLICVNKGRIYNVIIDLRKNSPTYAKWFGIELSDDSHTLLYVPKGCANGYITLTNDVEVSYSISEYYHPDLQSGVCYNDPAFSIDWPAMPEYISERDLHFPSYDTYR